MIEAGYVIALDVPVNSDDCYTSDPDVFHEFDENAMYRLAEAHESARNARADGSPSPVSRSELPITGKNLFSAGLW